MRRYWKLLIYSFAATLFCLLVVYAIGAVGVSLGNEQQAEEQLARLMERGTLTEEEFRKFQEEFKRSRAEKAESIDFSHILTQRVRLYSWFIVWIPWFLVGVILLSFSPVEFVVLMFLPVLLFAAGMLTPIDILIYGTALALGRLARPYVTKKKSFVKQ